MPTPQDEVSQYSRGKRDFISFLKQLTKFDKYHKSDPVFFLQPLPEKNSSLSTLNYFPCALSAIDQGYRVLRDYNMQGYGCHFALHEFGKNGDMSRGRVEENCSRVRCFCVDVDGYVGSDEIEGLIKVFSPSVVVASSREMGGKDGFKIHLYWVVGVDKGWLLDVWGDLQLALAYKIDWKIGRDVCDKNIRSLSKTLRLPGFFHKKDPENVYRSRVVYENPDVVITDENFKSFFRGLGIDSLYVKSCLVMEQHKKIEARSKKNKVGKETAGGTAEKDGFESRYGGAEEGNRNQTLMEYVSDLFFVRKFSYREALGAALVENKEENDPPLKREEVKVIVDSLFERWKGSLNEGTKKRIAKGDSLCARELFNREAEKKEKSLHSPEEEKFTYNYSDKNQFASLISDTSCAARMIQRYQGMVGKHAGEDTLCAYDSGSGLWKIGDSQVYSRIKFVLNDVIEEEGVLRKFYDKKGNFEEEKFENFKDGLFSSRKHDSVAKILKHDPKLEIEGEKFNAEGNLLHMNDGVLDIESGELKSHHRKHLMTFSCGYGFGDVKERKENIKRYFLESKGRDVEGWVDGHPWAKFVYEIMGGDAEMCVYLQKILGYILHGGNPHEYMFFFYGLGANGKTIFIETALRMLGTYGYAVPVSIFLENSRENKASIIAQLPGKRLISTSEVGKGKSWDEEVIKNLSGGDTINARQLFSRSFEFKPEFKTFVRGNHKPVINGTDFGIWRRICLIPFEVKFEEKTADTTLKTKFRTEKMLREILCWGLAGFRLYIEEGFQIPEKVKEAKEDYRKEMNPLEGFLSEYFEDDDTIGGGVRCEEILQAYNLWRVDLGQEKLSLSTMARRLGELGVKSRIGKIERHSVRLYAKKLKVEMKKKVTASRNVISLH